MHPQSLDPTKSPPFLGSEPSWLRHVREFLLRGWDQVTALDLWKEQGED